MHAAALALLTRFNTLLVDGRRAGDKGDLGDLHFWGERGG
jgi:hypothetical protein